MNTAVAIQNSADELLLIRREDFQVWALPGGYVDPDETPAECALREVYEETGLTTELTRCIGLYHQKAWFNGGIHVAVFAGRSLHGQITPQLAEVTDARFFPLSALPVELAWWDVHRIADLQRGACGVQVDQPGNWPFARHVTRAQVYALRDQLSLTGYQFYQRFLHPGPTYRDRLLLG